MIMSVQDFFNWFPNNAGWMLFFGGLIALTWVFYERKRKKGFVRFEKEDWDITDVSTFLRIISILGIFLGVLMIWAAVVGIRDNIAPSALYSTVTGPNYDLFTSIACIVVGAVCFMKPINDLPWAGIIGIFAAVGSGIFLGLRIEELGTILNPDFIQQFIIWASVIIGSLTGLVLKFWVGSIQTISKVLSYPPVALIVAIFCFIQSFCLISGGVTLIVIPPLG